MRSSSGATKLIAAMKKTPIIMKVKGRRRLGMVLSNTMEVRDLRGKVLDGWIVPPDGGSVQQKGLNGNLEYWIGWTNYPAPYWNEWNWFVWVGDEVYGAYTLWWYGTWMARFMV